MPASPSNVAVGAAAAVVAEAGAALVRSSLVPAAAATGAAACKEGVMPARKQDGCRGKRVSKARARFQAMRAQDQRLKRAAGVHSAPMPPGLPRVRGTLGEPELSWAAAPAAHFKGSARSWLLLGALMGYLCYPGPLARQATRAGQGGGHGRSLCPIGWVNGCRRAVHAHVLC